MERLTVFTPTYNRRNVIKRVYDSLVAQTYKDFFWFIIDDGSSDNTEELIFELKNENKIRIEYLYQENRGKHVAVNKALSSVNTELFIIADSDDAFVPEALEVLVNCWDSIEDKAKYKGVSCRVKEFDTGLPIGPDFPDSIFDSNDEEAYFKYKMRSEKWTLFRTAAFQEFMFPEIKNAHFYPETVTWQLMARKYSTRYINEPLRIYYRDTDNSVTNGKSSVRYVENIHLWAHFVNNEMHYFKYYPKRFIQSFIGISRDGILNGYRFNDIIGIPNTLFKRMICLFFFPIGWMLSIKLVKNK